MYEESELQQFMNDFDNKGAGGLDTSGGVQDNTVNKPKMVLKDSSKYVKKKPSQKMQQAPSNLNLS